VVAVRAKTADLFDRSQPERRPTSRLRRRWQGLVVGRAKRDGLKFGREFEEKQT